MVKCLSVCRCGDFVILFTGLMIFCYVISGGVLVGPFSEFEPLSYHLSFRRNSSRAWHLLFYRNWNIAGTSVWPILMKFGSHNTYMRAAWCIFMYFFAKINFCLKAIFSIYLLERKKIEICEKKKKQIQLGAG